ncbi:RNA pseudouridine synthase 7-like [Papaver somniferum]|uniref:RNA pseudouridine synthase 7-like n=1 Tax=Papaver somniferum TaxID=3469 RepID=UPI000E6F8A57|nr:RNA pseudouridine synthase 7-like [Papaver somniferum]
MVKDGPLRMNKRKALSAETEKEIETTNMDFEKIVWQTPANPPERQDYIFRNGRRHVKPYYFEFISHVNKRWNGKTIVDLFTDEFRGRPRDYYVSAVKCGRIKVDGKMVDVSYIVRNSQKITHFLHRHEPPVMAWDIPILLEEPDVVVICKPASIPVHPCGQYRKNTVVGILEAEHGLAPLFPVHRLDRLVSGLLIIARSAVKADQLRQQIMAREVRKEYIARVVGVFPEKQQVVSANVDHDAREQRSTAEVDTNSAGKSACTKFTRVSTNGTHSIVLCEPVTGRTHQIRVHLQHLGHPIANDVLYLSKDVAPRPGQATGNKAANREPSPTSDIPLDSSSDLVEKKSGEDFSIDPMCTNCPDLAPKGYGEIEEALWLHCAKYSAPGWAYECPYPDWALLN